jgi:mitochondrial fission protein ELM1
VLLSDGIPGHFRCAEGILEAARRLANFDVATISVRRSRLVPGRFLAWLTDGRRLDPSTILSRVYGVTVHDVPRPDLIVSAGGDTLAANIALARLTGSPNIFFGSLRRYSPDDFSLALNSYPAAQVGGQQARILKPSPADPSILPVVDTEHRERPRLCGLLVGGPSGDARWTERDWELLFQFLQQTHLKFGITWIVSNSRRTPSSVSDRFNALSEDAAGMIRRFIDVRAAGSGTLTDLFQQCAAVAVTADSSAMLSEAVWMQRPTVALRPTDMVLPKKEVEYRNWLEERHLFRDLELADISPERYVAALREVAPMAENPQEELARLLAAKLPALFAD